MLENEDVLLDTIKQGVQEGALGLLSEGKLRYKEELFSSELIEETEVLRDNVVQDMLKEELSQISDVDTTIIDMQRPTTIHKIILKIQVPWDKLSDLIRGMFVPLNREGAKISLEMEIKAESDKGINNDIIDLKVKETLSQVGATIIDEEVEKTKE